MRLDLSGPIKFPILKVAFGWLLLAEGVGFLLDKSLTSLWICWSLAVFDLFLLKKLFSSVIASMNQTDRIWKPMMWVSLKVFCLGLFGFVLLKAQNDSYYGWIMGLGTLVFVPLFVGIRMNVVSEVNHA